MALPARGNHGSNDDSTSVLTTDDGGTSYRPARRVQCPPVLFLKLDRDLLLAMRTRGHTPALERALGAYSRIGEHAACWLALGGAGAALATDPDERRRWLRGLRIVAAAYGLNYAIKLAVRRRRPALEGLPPLTPTVSGLSFPSAHTTTSFAAAVAYRDLVPPAALYGAAGLFALSRPYLGVHYPSDVLAGALVGTLLAKAWPR
jgi:membrane-associated phospholipid phosphatase